MPAAAFAEEALEIYNRMLEIEFDDVDNLVKLEWRLRSLLKKSSKDFSVQVAYLKVLSKLGKASEAISIANSLWNARYQLEPQVLFTYVQIIVELGMYSKALKLLDEPSARGFLHDNYWLVTMLSSALAVGNIALAKKLSVFETKNTARNLCAYDDVLEALENIEKSDFGAHFHKHQSIVNEAVFGIQSAQHFMFVNADEGSEINHYIFVSLEKEERRDLCEKIFDNLDSYYESVGLPIAAHQPYINNMIVDITAHWRERAR